MYLRIPSVLVPVLALLVCVSAYADINLTNGADIDMTGSTGSTIIFSDGSV